VIYELTCESTGERYVGITVARRRAFLKSARIRFQGHVYHATAENRGCPIHERIRDHGPESFTVRILRVVRGKAAAHETERHLVATRRPELNVLLTSNR